ncbi:hypothetical protein TNCV_2049241 [Trichonephila clavipes]|nr:hypothetical protein TNCV_2049241 [Trichonephila clavipes]
MLNEIQALSFLNQKARAIKFIVSFKQFYNYDARLKYIKAALKTYAPSSWQILPRNNPASNYPSDFEVVQLQSDIVENGLPALRKHHSIKHVTPQRKVTRTLTSLDESDINRINSRINANALPS